MERVLRDPERVVRPPTRGQKPLDPERSGPSPSIRIKAPTAELDAIRARAEREETTVAAITRDAWRGEGTSPTLAAPPATAPTFAAQDGRRLVQVLHTFVARTLGVPEERMTRAQFIGAIEDVNYSASSAATRALDIPDEDD